MSVICDDTLRDISLNSVIDNGLTHLQTKLSEKENKCDICVCDDTITIRGSIQEVISAYILAEKVLITVRTVIWHY